MNLDVAEAWLQAVGRTSDHAAFEAVFHHYAPRIKGMYGSSGVAPALADEATQEAMLTIWRKAHLFDPARGSASAWIFTVARNVLISRMRQINRPTLDPNDPLLVPEAVPVEGAAIMMQEHAHLRKAMADLPPEQRETLQEVYLRDRTLKQVADEQKIPLGTVKTRVRLALGRLRAHLGRTET